MEAVSIATRRVQDEGGRERVYQYDLLVDLIQTHRFACEDYGVRVTEVGGETVSIPNVTVRADRIDELLSLLVGHSVGPTGTADVVADWL